MLTTCWPSKFGWRDIFCFRNSVAQEKMCWWEKKSSARTSVRGDFPARARESTGGDLLIDILFGCTGIFWPPAGFRKIGWPRNFRPQRKSVGGGIFDLSENRLRRNFLTRNENSNLVGHEISDLCVNWLHRNILTRAQNLNFAFGWTQTILCCRHKTYT